MNTQERDLITDLFRRMRSIAPVEKDREAEALIAEEMRSVPDAPYVMAQTVLVQEMALKKADERIRELEAQAASAATGARGGGGGFLGGFLGLGSAANNDAGERGGSVPPVSASREAPYPRPGEPLPPMRSGGSGPGQPPPGGGGSFLGQAMATATGVAGGLLLGEGLRGLLGGAGAAHAAGTPAAAAATPKEPTPPAPASSEPHYQDANDNDPGAAHADQSDADADGDDEADFDDDYDDFDDSIDV